MAKLIYKNGTTGVILRVRINDLDGLPLTGLKGAEPATVLIRTIQNGSEDPPVNEVQGVVLSGAAGGTFTLTTPGGTTGPIAYDATADDVQTALGAVIGSLCVSCGGGPLPETEVTVTFQDAWGEGDIAEMTGDGGGLTADATEGLIISTIADNEATATAYAAADSEIESIAALGTYAAPSSGRCRFAEVDSVNHPGLYELQLADARLAVSGARSAVISLSGAAGMAQCDVELQLTSVDLNDGVHGGMTGLPLNTAWTDARAALLDKLNIGGSLVASSAEVVAIQNNTRAVRVVPPVIERPDSGSTAYRIELLLYDSQGQMESPDSTPTVSVANQAGASRDANLDSTTMTPVSTGRYRSTYTVAGDHAVEELIFTFTVVEGGNTRAYANAALVVDTTAVDFTAADRATLDAIHSEIDGHGTQLEEIQERTDRLPDAPAAAGGAVALTPSERNALADAVLARDVRYVEASAAEHSLCYVILAAGESDTTTHAGKLTVFRTDGTTEFVQKAIQTAAGGTLITGVT